MDKNGSGGRRADGPGAQAEVAFLRERVRAAGLPEQALAAADYELARLERLPTSSSEYGLTRGYVDWLLALPWKTRTEDQLDAKAARRQLDRGHYGLEYVKWQVANHLGVMNLRGDGRGPVLCFVGPPGTGKTSLGHSIARILGRKFIRISLRGLADEADIVGQRRTWTDAQPGRIMRGIRSAGVSNPVFMLEDVDKLGTGGRGDVCAALFEALDSKLRSRFADHYLDVPFDLSGVFFIVTASLFEAVPQSLAGALEAVKLPGYVQEEKYQIARGFLIPREREKCGLDESQFDLDEWSLKELSRLHPDEAGVDGLQERLGELARRAAGLIAQGQERMVKLDRDRLVEWLEVPPADRDAARVPEVGIAKAAVITPNGASISNVEVTRALGQPQVTLTGPQSQRMRELVQTAQTILGARARRFDLDPDMLAKNHLHIHFHDELARSDLTSMGLAIVAAMLSAFTNKPLRADLAVTGEISLRGRLRPVPGVVQKVLAARRRELAHVVVPRENAPELDRLPAYVREAVRIHPVSTVDEALELALLQIIVPKPEEMSAIGMFQVDAPGDPPNAPRD